MDEFPLKRLYAVNFGPVLFTIRLSAPPLGNVGLRLRRMCLKGKSRRLVNSLEDTTSIDEYVGTIMYHCPIPVEFKLPLSLFLVPMCLDKFRVENNIFPKIVLICRVKNVLLDLGSLCIEL